MGQFSISGVSPSAYTEPAQSDSTEQKAEVTIDVMNGLIKRQTKNERRIAKRNGEVISKNEARKRAEISVKKDCTIMSDSTQYARRQSLYEDLKENNELYCLNIPDKKLKKAAFEWWDPSAISVIHMELAGQKKHTGDSVLKKLTKIKLF